MDVAAVKQKKRSSGIDLIKITAMFLVVVLHINGMGGVLANVGNPIIQYLLNIIFSVSLSCINLFAIVTGFIYCEKSVKYNKIISLWMQVLFYSVGLVAVLLLLGKEIATKDIIRSFFPLSLRNYWYFTEYTILFLFIPIYNKAINLLNKTRHAVCLTVLILLTSFIDTFALRDSFGVNNGASFLWFSVMYFIGGYIKKYVDIKSVSKLKCIFAVIISSALAACIEFVFMYHSFFSFNDFVYERIEYSCSYFNSPTTLVISVAMFLLLVGAELKSCKLKKTISFFSLTSFTVYLIHTHFIVFDNYIDGKFTALADYPPAAVPLILIGVSLVIYVACSCIGFLQIKLFEILKIEKLCIFIKNKISFLFNYFYKKLSKTVNS